MSIGSAMTTLLWPTDHRPPGSAKTLPCFDQRGRSFVPTWLVRRPQWRAGARSAEGDRRPPSRSVRAAVRHCVHARSRRDPCMMMSTTSLATKLRGSRDSLGDALGTCSRGGTKRPPRPPAPLRPQGCSVEACFRCPPSVLRSSSGTLSTNPACGDKPRRPRSRER